MSFQSVQPRYLDPKTPVNDAYVPPAPPNYATQAKWSHVPARFLEPVAKPQPADPPRGESPIAGWRGAAEHREMTRRIGFGSVPSRYLESADARNLAGTDRDPRLLVEINKQERRLELGWRGTRDVHHQSFERIAAASGRAATPTRRKNNVHSPVMEYVRHGTPIERGSPRPGSVPPPPPVTPRRAGSPARSAMRGESQLAASLRDLTRTRGGPQWRGMVTQCTDFDTVRKQTAAARPYFARAETEIRERQQRAMSRVVPAGFVPRVATLSIAYQLPDLENGGADEPEAEAVPQAARPASAMKQADALSRTSSAGAAPPAAVERQRSRSLASQQAAVISAMASAQQSSEPAASASIQPSATTTAGTTASSLPWQLERTPFAASTFGTPNPSYSIQPQYAAPTLGAATPSDDAPRFAFRPFTVGHF